MKKLLLKSLGVLSSCVLILWVATFFLTFNSYKDEMQAFFKQNYDLEITIKDDITSSIFPMPHLNLQTVEIQNAAGRVVYSGNIVIYITAQIFRDKDVINSIDSVVIENASFDINEFIERFQQNTLNAEKAPTIKLLNVVVSAGAACVECLKIDELRLGLASSFIGHSYEVYADFQLGGERYILDGALNGVNSQGDVDEAKVDFKNEYFSWSIKGSGSDIYQSPRLLGKSSLQIKNLRQAYDSLQKIISLVSTNAGNTTSENALKENALTIDADAAFTLNTMRISNIVFTASGISNFQGEIAVTLLDSKLESYFRINADEFDLDAFINGEKINDVHSLLKLVNTHSTISNNAELDGIMIAYIDLNIKKMNLLNYPFSNVILRADVMDGIIYIDAATAALKNDGIVQIAGYYSSNQYRPRFDGSVLMIASNIQVDMPWAVNKQANTSHIKNLKLQSDIAMMPHIIRFDNVVLTADSSTVLGMMSLVKDGPDRYIVDSSITLDEINFDQFGLPDKIIEHIALLYQSDPDKSGETYFEAVDDYKWLRYLNYTFSTDILIDRAIFRGVQLNHLFASALMEPNALSIINLAFDTTDTVLKNGKAKLRLPSFKPILDVVFDFESLNVNTVAKLFPDINQISNTTNTDRVNMYSLYNFDGSATLCANNMMISGNVLQNVNLSFALRDGIITLVDGKAKIFNGDLIARGNVSAIDYVPQLNCSFTLNNINPGMLLRAGADIDKMSGYMSIGGYASTNGETWSNVLKRITGKMKFIGKNITWRGFGLDDIIKSQELFTSADDKISRVQYYAKYGSTFFNDVKGDALIAGPLLSLDNVLLSNNRVSGAFAARYDMMSNAVNYLVRFAYIPSGFTLPISIGSSGQGPVKTINADLDLTQISKFIYDTSIKSRTNDNNNNNDIGSFRGLGGSD